MDIVLLPKQSLRIKGKNTSFVIDPVEKGVFSAALALNRTIEEMNIGPDTVAIDSPGEYEIGGVKMNVLRNDKYLVYNPVVDGIEMLVGKISSFEKMQSKLKEQNIVVIYADAAIDASFIISLASNVVIFYGEHARQLAASSGKDNLTNTSKYSVVYDKLPQEVEAVVLE
jgi:hypothetical protein